MKYIFISLILLETFIFFFLKQEKSSKEESLFISKTAQLEAEYSSLINSYEKVTITIFDEVISNKNILILMNQLNSNNKSLIRENLYNLLQSTYFRLKDKHLNYMQFQLPNGEAFLRFHKNDTFNDIQNRSSINELNRAKVYLKGFEVGEYFSGFRYIFPLMYENRYLGSVEIAISTNNFKDELTKLFPHNRYKFIIKKDVVESIVTNKDIYTDNSIEGFVYMKDAEDCTSCDIGKHLTKDKIIEINKDISSKALSNIKLNKSFCIPYEFENISYIVTFIPINDISNNEVAYLISYSIDRNLIDFERDFFIKFLITTLLLIVGAILAFVTKQKISVTKELNEALKDKIKELNINQKRLKNQLYQDTLTKLPNRLKLLKDIKAREKAYIGLINIDAFKEINDFYGEHIGDALLKRITNKIINFIPHKEYKLYKMPADEYVVIAKKEINDEQFSNFIKSLTDHLESKPFLCQNYEIYLGFTASIVIGNREGILEKANMALKRARKDKMPYIIYDESMDESKAYENHIKWLKILKNALENDRIVPFFQPIYNNETGQIQKYEALVRLIKEDGEVVSPFFFLEVVKKSKLYPLLTKRMIEKSFEIFKDKEYELSINLSVDDISNMETIKFILDKLSKIDFTHRIAFEILESEGIENYEEVQEFIKQVKAMGCKIAIDDFGVGYSNFEYLINLDVDYLKIDGSLIKNIDRDTFEIIIETIVNFTKRVDIKTVAEFVSSEEIFDKVKKLNINFSQGYLLGKPTDKI